MLTHPGTQVVFTYDWDAGAVVERTCETWGYPNRDSEGKTMFDNTHFHTWEEAHEKLLRELEAGISLDTTSRTESLTRIRVLETRIADTATKLVTAKRVAEDRRP